MTYMCTRAVSTFIHRNICECIGSGIVHHTICRRILCVYVCIYMCSIYMWYMCSTLQHRTTCSRAVDAQILLKWIHKYVNKWLDRRINDSIGVVRCVYICSQKYLTPYILVIQKYLTPYIPYLQIWICMAAEMDSPSESCAVSTFIHRNTWHPTY